MNEEIEVLESIEPVYCVYCKNQILPNEPIKKNRTKFYHRECWCMVSQGVVEELNFE